VDGESPRELVDRAYAVGAFATASPSVLPDRRGVIRRFGIVQITLGIMSGLVAVLILLAVDADRKVLLFTLMYAAAAANLLWTGLGSTSLASWAPRATVISASIWLGFVLLAVAVQLIRGPLRVNMIKVPLYVGAVAFAIVLIIVYTRSSVRATFERY
jgi:hypothetical protein